MGFEDYLIAACDLYRELGAADIRKTQEPMRPLTRPNRQGQFKAIFTEKAEPDFKGTLAGGREIIFEVKSTGRGQIEQRVVTTKQRDALDSHHAAGAQCFVVVTFDGYRAYRIPWYVWRHMSLYFGRKYLVEKDLEKYRLPFMRAFLPDILYGIAGPDDIRLKGVADVRTMMTAYFGLPTGTPLATEVSGTAFARLEELLDNVAALTGASMGHILARLETALDREKQAEGQHDDG